MAADLMSGVAPFRIRGVLFDVDGTLYRQWPVRACMMAELAAVAATGSLRQARRASAAILTFRTVREELRVLGAAHAPLERLQFEETARRLGADCDAVRALLADWMFERPLKYLRAARRRDIASLLERLRQGGVRAGVLSDYPARPKLEALGLGDTFSLVLCTTDRAINAFKPHPRGFLRACELWDLTPEEVLYVGDRADTDAAGAAAAGMAYHLLAGRRRSACGGDTADDSIRCLLGALQRSGSG